jgi:hypothetical protein
VLNNSHAQSLFVIRGPCCTGIGYTDIAIIALLVIICARISADYCHALTLLTCTRVTSTGTSAVDKIHPRHARSIDITSYLAPTTLPLSLARLRSSKFLQISQHIVSTLLTALLKIIQRRTRTRFVLRTLKPVDRIADTLAIFTHPRAGQLFLLADSCVKLFHEVVEDLPATIVVVVQLEFDALFCAREA